MAASWKAALKMTLENAGVVKGLRDHEKAATAADSATKKATASLTSMGSAGLRAAKGVSSALGGLSNILFKLPQQVTAVKGMLGGLALPSRLAGSFETTSVAFRVLIGDAHKADEVLNKIRDLANSTPFEFSELAGAARLLAAFGEKADAIPEVLRRIGDVASATSTSVGELAEIYGKGRVQGTLFAEDINQMLGRGIPVIAEFAKQLGVSEGEVKKLASEGLVTFPMLETAFRDLTGEGGKFAGMMQEISGTFEGKLSTLTDSIKTLMATLGAGVNEGLKPVFDELTSQLDGQQGLARSVGKGLGESIELALDTIMSGQLGEVLIASFQLAGARLEEAIMVALRKVELAAMKVAMLLDAEKAGEYMMTPAAVTAARENRFIHQDADGEATKAAQKRLDDAMKPARERGAARHQEAAEQKMKNDEEAAADKAMRESDSWQALNRTGRFSDENIEKMLPQGPERSQGGGIPAGEAGPGELLPAPLLDAAPKTPAAKPAARVRTPITSASQGMEGGAAPPTRPDGRRRIRGAVSTMRNFQGLDGYSFEQQGVGNNRRADRMAAMGTGAARAQRAAGGSAGHDPALAIAKKHLAQAEEAVRVLKNIEQKRAAR